MTPGVAVVLAVAAIAGVPRHAGAQLVDVSEPCYVVLFGNDTENVLARGAPGTRAHLEAAAITIRTTTSTVLDLVRRALKANAALTPVQLEGLRGHHRCLPWLHRQLGLIVGQLKGLGTQRLPAPDARHLLPIDQFVKEVVDALKDAERLLVQVLKIR